MRIYLNENTLSVGQELTEQKHDVAQRIKRDHDQLEKRHVKVGNQCFMSKEVSITPEKKIIIIQSPKNTVLSIRIENMCILGNPVRKIK